MLSGSGKDASIYLVIMKNAETSHFDSISLKEQPECENKEGIDIVLLLSLLGESFGKRVDNVWSWDI